MTAQLLVVAKAPVPGAVKTRLGAETGMVAAAELAAAALLDTLEACAAAFPGRCHLALEGDLTAARRGDELREAVVGWSIFAQVGDGLGQRLAHAHAVVAATDDPVLQLGMDTPQVTAAALDEVLAPLAHGADAVLAPARDGGWWALALADSRRAAVLADVPMSRPDTAEVTSRALARDGSTVLWGLTRLRDVDTVADATAVAAEAPGTRFARAWAAGTVVAS